MKNTITQVIAAFLIAGAGFGCSSATKIKSTDPEAKIYLGDEYLGQGEVSYSDAKTIHSITTFRLEKKGCAPQNYNLVRNEELRTPRLFLLPVSYFWLYDYKPEHVYNYACNNAK